MRKAYPSDDKSAKAAVVPVETLHSKNRDVVKAIVFGGNDLVEVNKAAEESESNALTDEPTDISFKKDGLIAPPFDLLTLAMLEENSSELRQCVEAMVVNIEGFGGRIAVREMTPKEKESNSKAIEAEARELKRFLANLNYMEDLTSLRKKVRRDLELTGNGYWEMIPAKGDAKKIVSIGHVESHTVAMSKQDSEATPVVRRMLDPTTGEEFEQTFLVKFRRFVQVRNRKKVWFKQFGDPRIIDKRTGDVYADEKSAAAKKVGPEFWANSLFHFRIYSSRTPYGLPRFIGNLFSIFGSRASDEINYNTFLNNNVPSMAILVSGNAMLTEGTIRRIEDFVSAVTKRTTNYSKFLLLEAEPAAEGTQNSGTAKIEIVPLQNTQKEDQLFQNYDKNNSEKVRRAFRLPPILVGKSEDYNRGTAETSRKLAEEQIFSPERKEMDRQISEMFLQMGYKYHEYKSFSPNVTDDEDIVKLLSSIEKTGALTPNKARELVADILNKEPDLYDEKEAGFNPNVPFSLTMAEAVKGDGELGGTPRTGKLAPNQGQLPKPGKGAANAEKSSPLKVVQLDDLYDEKGEFDYEKVTDVHSALEKFLDQTLHMELENESRPSQPT